MNKFSELHDDKRIVFCKIDHVMNEFERVSSLPHEVVMLIMNGDFSFTESKLKYKPHNVKHIFATNSTVYNDVVTPIPIGVENSINPKREGHGMINDGIFEKLPFLLGEEIVEPETYVDKLYANFNVYTNMEYRSLIRKICIESENVVFETGLSYRDYVKKIKEHLAVVSPTGNGLECIRTYETLYLDRIPVCVGNPKNYAAIYNAIYKFLPIVFLSNPQDLNNSLLVKSEIKKVKNHSKELIDYEYWIDQIIKKL
jgi:hypothetical protein